MTALAIADQFDAYSAELVTTPTPTAVAHRASLVVCDRAANRNEAHELLAMLGLLPEPGHGRITALAKHLQENENPCPACRVLLDDLVQGDHVRPVAS